MPTIRNLDLSITRDSNGVVTAQVDYVLEFNTPETQANISFEELVALFRPVGTRDLYSLQALPMPTSSSPGLQLAVSQVDGDANMDRAVATLFSQTHSFDSLGVPATPGGTSATKVPRSFKKTLDAGELVSLLETGREHPYVVVYVMPAGIGPDIQLRHVDIDVGDPGEPGDTGF